VQIATRAVALSSANPKTRCPSPQSGQLNKPPNWVQYLRCRHPPGTLDLINFAAGMLLRRPPARFDCATSPPRRSRLPGRSRPAPTLTRAPRNGARTDCHVPYQHPMRGRRQACGGAGCDAGELRPVSPRKRASIQARWTTGQEGFAWSCVIVAVC
jgi:hypothetical protein